MKIRPLLVPLGVITAGALLGGVFGGRALATSRKLDDSLKTYTQILSVVEDRYLEEVPTQHLVYGSIRGMLRTLDPHSNFLDEESYRDMQEEQRGAFYGLGIVINKPGKDLPLTVISPIDGTPAARMGIRAGDVITHIVDKAAGVDVDTIGLDVRDAVKYLRGPRGSEVKISIERAGFDEALQFTIQRDTVPTNSITNAFMIDERTGYIKLTSFTQTSTEELDKAISSLESQGMEHLILDLRGNPGGLLDQAVKIADRFLGEGEMIVYTRGRIRGSDQEYRATDGDIEFTLPVVVLVDDGSASASEIVAGALQDHDRALIVGETTFGKGLVQSVFRLSRNTGLALTTAKYYTPSGRLIQRDYSSLEGYYLGEHPEIGAAREVTHTSAGREVLGGGGIMPDVEVKRDERPRLLVDLARRNALFEYAVRYASTHPDIPREGPGESATMEAFRKSFQPSDELIQGFREYLREKETSFDEAEFDRLSPEIKSLLKAEIVGVAGGLAYRDRVLIEDDNQVRAALGSFGQAQALAHGILPAPASASTPSPDASASAR